VLATLQHLRKEHALEHTLWRQLIMSKRSADKKEKKRRKVNKRIRV
jgi:hypothetical protein